MSGSQLERLSRPISRLLGLPVEEMAAGLVPAALSDLPGIIQLRRTVIGDQLRWDDEAYLRWRYALTGASQAPGGAPVGRLWVLRRKQELLGCLGTEELSLATESGPRTALRFLDLMVDPAVNGMGLGAWLNLMLLPRADVGMAVGASPQSIGLLDRLFHRLHDRRIWVMPLRTAPLLVQRWPWTKGVAPLSVGVDMILAGRRKLMAGLEALPLDLVDLESPALEVDALSRTMAESGWTMVPRSAGFWQWRFGDCPRRSYRFRSLRRDGKVLAALVWRQAEDVADVVDYVWDASLPENEQRAVLVAAFSRIGDQARRSKASKLRVMTYQPFLDSVCRKLAMIERPGSRPFAFHTATPDLDASLARARWFVTFGDTDGD